MLKSIGFTETPSKGSHTKLKKPLKKFGENKMMNNNLRYPMIIKWSDEDNCFLVGFPDFFGQEWRTHGDTYEEAFKNGIEALESLIISYKSTEDSLPIPSVLSSDNACAA